ncbi:MAG: type II toxin-antitoxin system VapC family toxin, partial [Spirochaetota bacterium]
RCLEARARRRSREHHSRTSSHPPYAQWLVSIAQGPSAFGLSEAVLSAFVRICTNPRIFREPTPTAEAVEFCDRLRGRPQARILRPGVRTWTIFPELCRTAPATGKLVADAWHAALAIEHGCEWVTTDADFARFPRLKWSHPLAK